MKMKDKIRMYEDLLHDIQMYAVVALDERKLQKLIKNICSWSYAHRVGNGALSDKSQQKIIDKAFLKLRDLD